MISTFITKRRAAGSRGNPSSTSNSFARYATHTARMAQSWMMIANALPRPSFTPRKSSAMFRWPVLDTGRNSVSPSRMPRMTACQMPRDSAFDNPSLDVAPGIGDARVEPMVPSRPDLSHGQESGNDGNGQQGQSFDWRNV